MKKIISKHHARTKSDNQFANISKLSNLDEEQYNTTSRDINKPITNIKNEISKEKLISKHKFSTHQREELYKIEENPTENLKNPNQKSRSLNTLSIKKVNNLLNNNQSKDEMNKDDKNQKQIKITIKYYKKKITHKNNDKSQNPQTIRNIFCYRDTLATQRNFNYHSKPSYKTSNIVLNDIKKPVDFKQLKQTFFNSSPSKTECILKTGSPGVIVSNVELSNGNNSNDLKENVISLNNHTKTTSNGISSLSNTEQVNSVRNSLSHANGSINLIQVTPCRVIDLTGSIKPEQLKMNYLSHSTNTKTTINPFNFSSNKSTHSKTNSTSNQNSQGKKPFQPSSCSHINEKIGYSFLKISKKDNSSGKVNDTARDNYGKTSINIIDVKKQLRNENEEIKNKKMWSSKTNSMERSKNSLKFNYDTNNNKQLSKSILSSVGKQNEAAESENTNFSKNNSRESLTIVKNDSGKINQQNYVALNLKNCENGGNFKFISNLSSTLDKGVKVDSILENIYKETLSKNGHIQINANYVPKKFLKDTTNEIRDDSLENRKNKKKGFVHNNEEENDEINSNDKTLIIDELSTNFPPNDVMKIQNSSRDLFKLRDVKIVQKEVINDMEFSKELEENCLNSGEEKNETITKLPLFISKKLSFYNSNSKENMRVYHSEPGNKRCITFFFKHTSLKTILKFNKSIKENIYSYLSIKDLVNFSLCSKFIRKETNGKIFDILINLIVNQNNIHVRLKIWKSLFRYSDLNNSNIHNICYSLRQKVSPFEEEIKKDLLRTLPEDPTFKVGKANYKKLYNILRAYSNYNTNIGYAQGLNFIVANSIFVLNDEEEALIFLDSFIKKFDLASMMGMKNNSVRKKLFEIERIIKRFIPDLVKFLETNYLNHEFFTTQWVITIFANSVKSHNLFKIWDFAIIYGWKFLNYLIVSILLTFKHIIINYDVNHLSPFIKNLLKSDLFDESFIHIINMTFDMLNEFE